MVQILETLPQSINVYGIYTRDHCYVAFEEYGMGCYLISKSSKIKSCCESNSGDKIEFEHYLTFEYVDNYKESNKLLGDCESIDEVQEFTVIPESFLHCRRKYVTYVLTRNDSDNITLVSEHDSKLKIKISIDTSASGNGQILLDLMGEEKCRYILRHESELEKWTSSNNIVFDNDYELKIINDSTVKIIHELKENEFLYKLNEYSYKSDSSYGLINTNKYYVPKSYLNRLDYITKYNKNLKELSNDTNISDEQKEDFLRIPISQHLDADIVVNGFKTQKYRVKSQITKMDVMNFVYE